MKWIKKFESFSKYKNITVEDIRKAVHSGGKIFATKIKDFPDNNPDLPLTPLSVDDSGLVTVRGDRADFEIQLDQIDKIDLNEEISAKKALTVGAVAGLMGLGLYRGIDTYDNAKKSDTEVVSGRTFNQYQLTSNGEFFDINISDDFIICAEWSVSSGSGKHRTTEYYTSVTVAEGTKEIWVDTKFFDTGNSTFVSLKELKNGKKLKLIDLDIVDDEPTFTLYKGGFLSDLDYIIVNKNHKSGEEFEIEGTWGSFICDEIKHNVYLFWSATGSGKFGGGGAGSSY
jgi:hypothetical protein